MGKKRMESNKFVTINETEAAMFFYERIEQKSEEIIHFNGKEYKEKDWWIAAKYKNLKVELTQNKKCKIEMRQFEDLEIFANLHCDSEHNKLLRISKLDVEENKFKSIGMTNMHVLAVMVYCNYVVC